MPTDTPPASAAFLHQTTAGLWLWDGGAYRLLASAAALLDASLSSETPRWFKFTKTFTTLSAAATTNDIELFSLPAGGVVHAVKIKHSAAFTGGAISAYTVSVGIAGNLVKYSAAQNVFQAPGNTVFLLTATTGTENHGAATSIRLAATSTGANLNAATAGSVDVWVLLSKAV